MGVTSQVSAFHHYVPYAKMLVVRQKAAFNTMARTLKDDLMIVYLDLNRVPSKAIYFDNEGHIINYMVTYFDKSVVFLSDKIIDGPVFRLTYTLLDNGVINTLFEISQHGEKFTTYVEGKSKKIK